MARRIVITSGKGGVGKTTVCANLGYSLAQNGLKVLLFDADIGLNNLDVVLGVENKVVYDLMDVANGKCRAKQAIVQDPKIRNLYILPSNNIYNTLDINGSNLKCVLDELDSHFDYILIDCPAGIENGFLRAVNCSSEVIVITTPHLSAIRDADKVITILNNTCINLMGVIVNRLRGDLILENQMLDISSIEKYLKCKVIGAIPEDDVICQQLISGGSLVKKSHVYFSFRDIVHYIHNGSEKVYDCTQKYKGFWGSIKRKLRRWV